MKRMHEWWRVKKLCTALKADEEALVRQKIVAYDIFKGKKPWNPKRSFKGDYVDIPSNITASNYRAACQMLFKEFNEEHIAFSSVVLKANSKNKTDKRILTVAQNYIYKQDPKKYSKKQFENPISAIESISVSPNKDQWVVVHAKAPHRDIVIDLGQDGEERVSEFVTVLTTAHSRLTSETLKVNFTNTIKYNNSRTPKNPNGVVHSLSFESATDADKPKLTSSGTLFKSGKDHNTVVYGDPPETPSK